MWNWLKTGYTPPRSPEPFDPEPVETVAVSLVTGSTVIGALILQTEDVLILKAAILVGVDRNQNEAREPLDGETVIPREKVEFWQTGLDPTVLSRIEER